MQRYQLHEMCTGPGKAWTALEQGEYLFQLAKRKPSFIKVPVGLLDGIIGILDFVGRVVPQWEVRCWSGLTGSVLQGIHSRADAKQCTSTDTDLGTPGATVQILCEAALKPWPCCL